MKAGETSSCWPSPRWTSAENFVRRENRSLCCNAGSLNFKHRRPPLCLKRCPPLGRKHPCSALARVPSAKFPPVSFSPKLLSTSVYVFMLTRTQTDLISKFVRRGLCVAGWLHPGLTDGGFSVLWTPHPVCYGRKPFTEGWPQTHFKWVCP